MSEVSTTYKVTTTASLALAIFANLRYALGRASHIPDTDGSTPPGEKIPSDDPFYRVGFTPFTANIIILFVYWGVLHMLQIVYVAQFYFGNRTIGSNSNSLTGALAGALRKGSLSLSSLGNHFVLFNLLQFSWSLLFAHGYYFWAELFVIANFINLVILYNSQPTYSIKDFGDYMVVHFPVTALPFSWLLYVLFWNGAVVVGSNSLAARIVANVFIWDFLIVPGFNLVIFRDWAIGLSSSFIVLGLALGQLFTKVFALQWIFAFVISGILFLSSIAIWSANLKESSSSSVNTDNENAPLITN